jgi:8-oxo-dGTP pyrophosphatase MutT (NUDIX family)
MANQVAAIPYRCADGGATELLLVNSSSGRWIIPKGDVDGGMAPHLAAEKEAFEEGGVRGRIGSTSIGTFRTFKMKNGAATPVEVSVYPLAVTEELDRWPEANRRERRWLPAKDAAAMVCEADLAAILSSFRP